MPLSEKEKLTEIVRHERAKMIISKTFDSSFYSKLTDEGISEAAIAALLAVMIATFYATITPDVTLSKVVAVIGVLISAIMCTAFGIWIMYHSRKEVMKMTEKLIQDEIAEDNRHIETLSS